MKKIISLVFSIMVLLNITALAHTAVLQNSGSGRYKAVRLTPEICNNANGNLSDILVKNEKGESVPYFINSSYQKIYKGKYNYPMSLINSYTKDDEFYFDYKLASVPEHDIQATSIEFFTKNTGFAKNIELFGSYDNINWEKIQNDTLYNVDDKAKLEITFKNPLKFTHYRLKLANNLEKIVFSSVQLNYNVTTSEKSYFAEEISPEFSIEEIEKQTYIYLKGLKNLRIDTVTILTDSMFKRTAAVKDKGVSKQIYNLTFGGTVYNDTTVQMKDNKFDENVLTLIIGNNDDKPINIQGVKVRYFAEEIVFEDKTGGNYKLEFKKDDTKLAPVYDIASYKDEILKENIDRLEIKEVSLDKTSEKPEKINFELIFNIVVVIITVLLGILIVLKLRRKQ